MAHIKKLPQTQRDQGQDLDPSQKIQGRRAPLYTKKVDRRKPHDRNRPQSRDLKIGHRMDARKKARKTDAERRKRPGRENQAMGPVEEKSQLRSKSLAKVDVLPARIWIERTQLSKD